MNKIVNEWVQIKIYINEMKCEQNIKSIHWNWKIKVKRLKF